MRFIGFIIIICAFAGISHGGINTGAIFGLVIGLTLMVPEYIFEFKPNNKNSVNKDNL